MTFKKSQCKHLFFPLDQGSDLKSPFIIWFIACLQLTVSFLALWKNRCHSFKHEFFCAAVFKPNTCPAVFNLISFMLKISRYKDILTPKWIAFFIQSHRHLASLFIQHLLIRSWVDDQLFECLFRWNSSLLLIVGGKRSQYISLCCFLAVLT